MMTAKMYMGEQGKIIPCFIHAGGSIGLHKHETSDDINYVMSGSGKAICDGKEELRLCRFYQRAEKKLLVFHLMPKRGQFMSEQYYISKKYHEISILATETAKRIVKNETEWTKYLEVAARLYKYPFADQMLIYAQRPGASACAAMEVWNEKCSVG